MEWYEGMGGRMNEKCTWSEDEDGLWWTACKEIHEFFDGTPTENSYKFCPYCGKVLIEKTLEYEGEDV
jgi:hypothetical protein